MARIWNGPIQRALVVENPAEELDGLLRAKGMDVLRLAHIPPEKELIQIMQENKTQVVFKRSKVKITKQLIEACPDLLAIQLCCIGDDSVDKKACAEHGIMVCNDPISNGQSVVELVLGNLIALSRRLFETDVECHQGVWNKNHDERYEIRGKALGVLGLGNIGRSVARNAQALGMQIHFHDTRLVSMELGKEMGWQYHDSIDSLFAAVDCVTVHLSSNDVKGNSNKGILQLSHFQLLGQQRPAGQRLFINFARGFLHTPEDLKTAIDQGYISRAAVDVYPHEPRTNEVWVNPYKEYSKVAVYPHIGASTQEAQPRIAHRVADTFVEFSRLGSLRDTVYQPRINLSLSDHDGKALLIVCHSTIRGTKKAIDEAIYQAGISNLSSLHKDFDEYGFAYDVALLDNALTEEQIEILVKSAAQLSSTEDVIRSVRQIVL